MSDQELLAYMKLSPNEKLSGMVKEMNRERREYPEKYPYPKSGFYIGGIRWEHGDDIITGARRVALYH